MAALILCHAAAGWGATFSGKVFDGSLRDESKPLADVTVALYGSNNSGQQGSWISQDTTDSAGHYDLESGGTFEYYNIVETNPGNYNSVGATTVSGSVINSDWIQYAYPLEGKTLTGNKFWDKKEGGQPPENHPPVANGGPDQFVTVGNVVQLDGSHSSDVDGDPLTYHWSLIWVPAGSGASLSNPTAVVATFLADKPGTYAAQLIVNDGKVDSSPATAVISATSQPGENHPPVANAGPDQFVTVGNVVQLDGSHSSDVDGDPLTYSWSLIERPPGSSAVLDNPASVQPKFTVDLPGPYVAQLIVNDGKVDSSPDTTVVSAEGQPPSEGGTIRGFKFNDENGDGIWNGTETGMSAWTIFLDMEPYNAQLDPGEPSDVTNQSGSYCFTDLAPGVYNVYEVAQAGWQITCPASGFYGITIHANDLYDHQDFGNHSEGGEPLEACCLPDGSCANLTPEQCRQHGGTAQGGGTVCIGDTCGGQPPKGNRYDLRDLCFVLDLDIPGLGHSSVTVTGNGTMEVQFEGPAPGAALDHDGNGRDELATELVSLSLTGMDPLFGQVGVSLNSALPSTGELEERTNTTPGILDLPPFVATGQADSFFDVFFEIDLLDLGLTLRASQAKHIQGVLDQLPAVQPVYTEPLQTTVPLLRQPGGVQAGSLGPLNSCQAGYRRDYGDAPAPYPDASHVPGQVWLGFAAPDTETGTQASPPGEGDDTHGTDDEDGAWLVLAPGQPAWLTLALSGLNQDLTYAVWIDYNGNGNWEHPAELYASGSVPKLPASPLGLVISNPIPTTAQAGLTYVRIRVYPGLDVPVSPSGDAQGGEVTDFQALIVRQPGGIEPPGHVIAGIKFNDLDGDGSWDPADGEALLPNWTIWLDTNNDGTADKTTQTDSLGGFEFTGLSAGTYTIGEQQQSNWTQTTPGGAGTYTVTVPAGPQPTIAFAMFGNRRTQEGRELDFGDAPDSYKTLQASGGACHKAGSLTLGASVDTETDGVPSPDATGDDLADKDDEDGLLSSLNLTTGKIVTISLTVANADASSDSGMVAGWIDFDGNGQFDLVSDDIGTQYVSVPGGGQSTVQLTFLVPVGAKAGKTYARFRLYRDDPNPLAIPWAILPTGAADYGEVEDYVVTIRSGISTNDRDYGDAPLPYPEASHPLGGPYLGLFGDLPDRDPGMQRDASASGDDTDADGDDENGLLSVNLVKNSSVWSHAEIKMWTSSTGALTGAIWIDWNADGDWDDPGELLGSTGMSSTPVPPGGAWIHVTWGFPVPAIAKPGNTFARLRVYEGFNVTLSPHGAGAAGEVEDHLVQIKAGGPGLLPGGIVHGYKWDDRDGDGAWDVAEPGLANWQIWLDLNGSGVEDAGDRYETTDGNGYFRFTGVPAGSYLVGEKAQTGWTQTCPSAPGTYTETVTPGWASVALLFANTRRSVQPPADKGRLDWGDAPDPTYPTLRSTNGAYHVIVPGFQLGGAIDPELDGQPSPDAMADDHVDVDDEDGVQFLTPLIPGEKARVEVQASKAGRLDAWLDFDGDGSWTQATDQIAKSLSVGSSTTLEFQVPAATPLGTWVYGRFRLSSKGGLSFNGPATDGEVEDYRVWIGEPGPGGPPQVIEHLKWSQRPIELDPNARKPPVFCGWDEPANSIKAAARDARSWKMLADDFHCLGPIPITHVRWCGSYQDWDQPELPGAQPAGWQISFWASRAADTSTGAPATKELVWQIQASPDRVQVQPIGRDQFPQRASEQCFLYDLRLDPDEFFWQSDFPTADEVFSISIVATYPDDVRVPNPWGWETRPAVWGEAASRFTVTGDGPQVDSILNPSELSPIENDLLCGQSQGYDLCFELLTDQPWVHWDQPFGGIREWPHYEDVESQATSIRGQESIGRLVADDWLCERNTPVIAAAWWGSYIGHGYETCQCEEKPDPPRPDYFLLRMWKNVPASRDVSDLPGEVVWEYRAFDYAEVLVGYDKNPEGEPNEPVYRYSVRLPEESWFRQTALGSIYWFSVTAVYTDPLPMLVHPWGWTNHPPASGIGAVFTDYRARPRPEWRPLRDPLDRPVDMSFTLFTAPQVSPSPKATVRSDNP